MSGKTRVVARNTSKTMHRNATERKNVITPEAIPMPALRKNLFIKEAAKDCKIKCTLE
jgi:hypothetical protein